jgi:hypothetical protein
MPETARKLGFAPAKNPTKSSRRIARPRKVFAVKVADDFF